MVQVQTRPELLESLRNAASRKLSASELREQEISFVTGTLGGESTLTREDVRKIIENRDDVETAR